MPRLATRYSRARFARHRRLFSTEGRLRSRQHGARHPRSHLGAALGGLERAGDARDVRGNGSIQGPTLMQSVKRPLGAERIARSLRDFCVFGCALLCSVVPNATGATRILVIKSMSNFHGATNQGVGSSNLSGRAIKSKSYATLSAASGYLLPKCYHLPR
jgi:hypothetical protein